MRRIGSVLRLLLVAGQSRVKPWTYGVRMSMRKEPAVDYADSVDVFRAKFTQMELGREKCDGGNFLQRIKSAIFNVI